MSQSASHLHVLPDPSNPSDSAIPAIVAQCRRTIERLTRLQSITAALASATTTADVGRTIIEEALPSLCATIGVVAIVDPEGKALTNVQVQGVSEQTQAQWSTYPIDSPVPVAEAARRATPIIVSTRLELSARYPMLAAMCGPDCGGAVVAYPLLQSGKVIGSLGFGFADDRTLDAVEHAYIQTIAQQCATALSRIQDDEARKASERKLQESQDVLSLAMRGGRMGAWSRDLNTNKIWWSSELKELFGIPGTGGVAESEADFFARLHPDDRPRVAAAVAAAISSGSDYSVEFRFRHSSGQWRWMEGRGRANYSASGKPTVLYGLCIDIRERKAAEAALQNSKAQLQLVSDTAPIFIASCDRQHRFKFVNKAYAERFGLRPEGVIGHHAREFIGAQGYELVLPYIERVLQGESVEYTVEVPYPGIGRKWMQCRYAPEVDDCGEVQGWVGAVLDVTEQKQAEEALRSRERELSLIYRNVSDVIFLLAVEGMDRFRYVSVNRAFLIATGLEEAAVVGKPISEVILEPACSRLLSKCQQAIHERTSVTWEDTTPFPSGTRTGVLVVTPLFDTQGACTNLVGTVHDVTELKRAESSLLEADRRKDEFLAMLAHELRNPLGPICNGVHILRKLGDDRQTRARILDMIQRQSSHMARIVDDLLDVSRITRGRILLRREELDLEALVRSTAQDYASQFQQKGVALTVSTPKVPVYVFGDKTRIAQSIGNLLHNAQKFTPSGGVTAVTLAVEGQQATITVADNGIGMDEATLARLFVPFAQAEQSLDRSAGGLGLGLSLVQGLIKLHGGTITVHSDGIGRGSTLRISLPLSRVDRPVATSPVAPDKLGSC